MVNSFPFSAARPAPGSVLHRWLRHHAVHPDSFDCGVRVIDGHLVGEGRRWRYRRSAVDPLITDGVRTLNHGTKVRLRLILDTDAFRDRTVGGTRVGHAVLAAVESGSGARVQISVPVSELDRFSVDPG
jgi:hypothetical protein